MTFEVAKKAIDYILTNPDVFPDEQVEWTFIGGEPLLEISLIDQICDYLKKEMYRLNHRWFDSYVIGITYNVAEKVSSLISLNSYISTFTSLTLLMGVVFQLPIVIFILAKKEVLSFKLLTKYRKVALFLIALFRLL